MTLAAHPFASIIPAMSEEEYVSLRQGIGAQGLQHPITLYQDQILDGRNRYRACDELGIEPRFDTYEGTDPVAHVLSLNIHRRHLSKTQLAMVALDVLEKYEEEARERQGARTDITEMFRQVTSARLGRRSQCWWA